MSPNIVVMAFAPVTRRLLAPRIVLALLVCSFASACGSQVEPSQVFRWLPDDAAPPVEVAQREPLPLCGVSDSAPAPAAMVRCAVGAYESGGAAEFVADLTTDGTRLVQILRVLPGRRVETISGTLSKVHGLPWLWETTRCTAIEAARDPSGIGVALVGCRPPVRLGG